MVAGRGLTAVRRRHAQRSHAQPPADSSIPRLQAKPNQPHADCPVKKKKAFYSCNGKDCKKHYWLCGTHQKFNDSKLKKSEKYWNDKGVTFVNFSVFKVSNSKAKAKKEKNDSKEPNIASSKESCPIEEAIGKLRAENSAWMDNIARHKSTSLEQYHLNRREGGVAAARQHYVRSGAGIFKYSLYENTPL